METYSQKPVTFIYFWSDYCDENHIERIPIAFLLSDATRIDDNEYLSSLENGTELIVCTEGQIQKLPIYFEIQIYLSLKNISRPLNIDYFL